MFLTRYNTAVLLIALTPAVIVEVGAVNADNALFFYLTCIVGILLAIREQLDHIQTAQSDDETQH